MARFILPNDDLALALREPNLLLPQNQAAGSVVIKNSSISNKLIGFWDFSQGAKNLVTNVASTFTGTPDLNHDSLGSYYFYASTEIITVDKKGGDDISLVSRIRPIDSGSSNRPFFGNLGAGNAGVEVLWRSTDEQIWWAHKNKFAVNLTGIQIEYDTWYTVGFTYSSSNGIVVYLDGVEIDSDSTSGTLGALNNFQFGNRGDSSGSLQSSADAHWAALWDRVLSAAEMRQMHLNGGYALLTEPANQSPFLIGVTAAGGDVNIAVTTGALTIAGVNAAISQAKNISVTTGALTIAGVNAVVLNGQEVSVTTGALTIAATNASIQQANNISVGVVALTIVGANTTVEKNLSVSAATGALTIAGVNAVIDQQAAGVNNIIVTTGALAVSGTGAAINQVSNLSIGTGSITVAGINPAIAQNRAVSAGVGALAIAGTNAVVLSGQQVSVGTGALTISGVDANIINVSSVLSTGIETLTARTLGGYQARSVN